MKTKEQLIKLIEEFRFMALCGDSQKEDSETLAEQIYQPPNVNNYCMCSHRGNPKPISETEYECIDCGKEIHQPSTKLSVEEWLQNEGYYKNYFYNVYGSFIIDMVNKYNEYKNQKP